MSKKISSYIINPTGNLHKRISDTLRLLGLEGMRTSFDKLAQEAIKENKTPYDFLDSLLEKEIAWKEANRIDRWIQQSNLPKGMTLDNFDFSFQSSINKAQIYDLSSCRFIEKAENIIFLGPEGVGKTHLASGLGYEAIFKGCEVKFLTLSQLIKLVDRYPDDGMSRQRLFRTLSLPRLLILDEIDLYRVSEEVSIFLLRLLREERYERGSIIFTSNKSFTQWGKLFGDNTQATTTIGRIIHHAHIITINGESYRLKGKK